jgi:hypothetical protein
MVDKAPQRYVVTAALAVGLTAEGQPVYAYRNAVLPESITQESVQHLLDTNLIAPVK